MYIPKAIVQFLFLLITLFTASVSCANSLFFSGSITSPGCGSENRSGHITLACRDTPSTPNEISLDTINEGDLSFRGMAVEIRNLGKDVSKKTVLLNYF